MSRPLEFRILGPLEVASDAGSLELPGKPRALLALLLLSQAEVVSVDRIGSETLGWARVLFPDGGGLDERAVRQPRTHHRRKNGALGRCRPLEETA